MKLFKGNIELRGDYRLKVFDKYFCIFDSNGKEIYYEDSAGYIVDKTPKPIKELTVSEISKMLGYEVKIVKEEKQ